MGFSSPVVQGISGHDKTLSFIPREESLEGSAQRSNKFKSHWGLLPYKDSDLQQLEILPFLDQLHFRYLGS